MRHCQAWAFVLIVGRDSTMVAKLSCGEVESKLTTVADFDQPENVRALQLHKFVEATMKRYQAEAAVESRHKNRGRSIGAGWSRLRNGGESMIEPLHES